MCLAGNGVFVLIAAKPIVSGQPIPLFATSAPFNRLKSFSANRAPENPFKTDASGRFQPDQWN
jgi:hypothetical protein